MESRCQGLKENLSGMEKFWNDHLAEKEENELLRKFMKGPDSRASELVTEIYTPKMFNRPGSGSEKEKHISQAGMSAG